MMPLFSITFVALTVIFSASLGGAIRCWDCNSGQGWNHDNCPTDGNLVFDRLTAVDCSELCFVRYNSQIPGTIFRGCSRWFWLPRPLPSSGCMFDGDDEWCFCDSDECNTMPMEAK